MDRNLPSTSGAFNSLPIELNKAIAHEFESDKDIISYRLVCRATNDAIDADNCSFWRAKFREKYAFKEDSSNTTLARHYQNRARQLRRGLAYDFFRGHKRREKDVVKVLRDLIVESFQGPSETDEYGRPHCKNHACLVHFISNSKILLNDRRAPQPHPNEPSHVHPTLAAVKLMCSHFLFEPEGAKHDVFAIEEVQRAVYLPTNVAPIYQGPKLTMINMEWVLHCLNFFRHHMMNEDAGTLSESVDALSVTQKPSAWQEPLREGAYPLSKNWMGTYSFLEMSEIRKLRSLTPDQVGDHYFIDKNIDEGKIQSLELDFVEDSQQLSWPTIFENRLHSLKNTAGPDIKTQGRGKPKGVNVVDPKQNNIQFVGKGEDLDDDFNAVGWLNPLPPQAGIHGWQRITFMKHFMDDFDQIDQVDQDNLWAYEGVVLPGGRIILGRWWFASDRVNFDNDYNGPFILWAVDSEPIFDGE
ncbi:hypothetical protein BKA66DRAFT_528087 [Pyrenochaeta sp. MPI-SDFR-AT-0127]|nr:hypothetical protein BKA66DRAFT_528087 [Pyrenochaeta sp. MPI-SDFR-AT-0127]